MNPDQRNPTLQSNDADWRSYDHQESEARDFAPSVNIPCQGSFQHYGGLSEVGNYDQVPSQILVLGQGVAEGHGSVQSPMRNKNLLQGHGFIQGQNTVQGQSVAQIQGHMQGQGLIQSHGLVETAGQSVMGMSRQQVFPGEVQHGDQYAMSNVSTNNSADAFARNPGPQACVAADYGAVCGSQQFYPPPGPPAVHLQPFPEPSGSGHQDVGFVQRGHFQQPLSGGQEFQLTNPSMHGFGQTQDSCSVVPVPYQQLNYTGVGSSNPQPLSLGVQNVPVTSHSFQSGDAGGGFGHNINLHQGVGGLDASTQQRLVAMANIGQPSACYQPGWIKAQLQLAQLQHQQQQQQQLTRDTTSHPPQPASLEVGIRPPSQHQFGSIRRANAVEARFRSLYPLGFPSKEGGGRATWSPLSANMPIRCSRTLPAAASDAGQFGRRSQRLAPVDPTSGVPRLPLPPEVYMANGLSSSDFHLSGEDSKPCQVAGLLDTVLMMEDGIHSLRDVACRFVRTTYGAFGRQTYCVPRKPAVNQHQPDKALVRTREGEFRVSLVLEQLSVHLEEGMFILGDYHFENFLFHLKSSTVQKAGAPLLAEKLRHLEKERYFGDFDFLIFHPLYGLIVVGLCTVSSNSDAQYILKRVQKARLQLERFIFVVDQYLTTVDINCPVTPIFCTPNLKRAFLTKITAKDRLTDRALARMPTLCSDHMPAQFRVAWSEEKRFKAFIDWWVKVKVDWLQGREKVSKDQMTLLLGCFLCPVLSRVEFDQNHPAEPSQLHQPLVKGGKSTDPPDTEKESEDIASLDMDFSSLTLNVGNVARSFSQYMEDYVDLYYPEFLTQTYRVPPIHFNIQKIRQQSGYDVLELPMSKDIRGDEGENRVVGAIEILGLRYEAVKPVFIICDFQYNNYLNKLKENMFTKGDDRRPRRAYGQSVRAQHDCLLLHRRHGIIIISVKAVGDNFEEWAHSGTEQWTAVCRILNKVLSQLPREESMVHRVLDDLHPGLPCKKLVALPNLNRQDIDTAISSDKDLQKKIMAMFPDLGTRAFLCKDELCDTKSSIWETFERNPDFFPKLCRWWDLVVGPGTPDVLSQHLYKQIIGRFCGLLSSVEVWTQQAPRVEVRNLSEAVQESGERFARIVLTPEQVSILQAPHKRVFLWGPPGVGKTVLLVLRAQRWLLSGGRVVILNLSYLSTGLALGHLLQRQIGKAASQSRGVDHKEGQGHSLSVPGSTSPTPSSPSSASQGSSPGSSPGRSAASRAASISSHILRVDLDLEEFDAQNPPDKVKDIPAGALILMDEVMKLSHAVLTWILDNKEPAEVWTAGQFRERCPPDFQLLSLHQILRCSPMVQRVLRFTGSELGSSGIAASEGRNWQTMDKSYVLSSAPYGLPTDGARPKLIFHSQHNSAARLPLDCEQCGRDLADYLQRSLHVRGSWGGEQARRHRIGPAPVTTESLSLKDVAIISRKVGPCDLSNALARAGLPVRTVDNPSSPQVAWPTDDAVLFTNPTAMTGLERKVVVYVVHDARDVLEKEGGDRGREGRLEREVDDLRLGQTLKDLTSEDCICLWYVASRCLGQLVLVVP